jgi:hypothetical protein
LQAAPHFEGAPVQTLPQHSALELQEAPSARHGAEQNLPPWPAVHVAPLQQSVSTMQKVPTGRHGPGPRSQRPSSAAVQTPLQQPPPVPSHAVSDPLHGPSETHFCATVSHLPEQQLASVVHPVSPSPMQRRPPHVPPLQAMEQQSKGRLHGEPSGWQ